MPADSPLLAEEQSNEVPALGTAQVELEQSPLERFIQQSTSEQRNTAAPTPFFLEEQYNSFSTIVTAPSFTQATGSLCLTLVAGSLCLLHSGMVWASFVSSAWFETHLLFTVDWLGTTDQLLHTTTLASLLSAFLSVDLHWAAVCLLLASLVLPCLSMILSAAWTVMDHRDRMSLRKDGPNYQRAGFEYILRLSLVTFFSLSILDVATCAIELVGNGTDLQIVNRTSGGLVCYTLGMCCALGVIAVLRLARASDERPTIVVQTVTSSSRRVPPNHAFQLPWRSHTDQDTDQALREQQQPLLDTEDTVQEINNENQTESAQSANGYRGLSFCKRVILYEAGIVSTILIPPAFLLPLFSLDFGGLASDFMTETTFTVRFWEFPIVLRQRGILAETEHWIPVALGTALIALVYVIPILATALSIGVWRLESTKSRLCQRILQVIQPCLCGIVFALSVLIAVPAFGPIGETLLNRKTSGVCDKFHLITSDNCLTINGEPGIGLWFLLVQSASLELFVTTTLAWIK
jgi:hypothetical protein